MQESATARPYVDPVLNSHILNFFQSTDGKTGNYAAGLHRILEFLMVPSPFVGTQLQSSPNAFSAPGNKHYYHPPFNYISNYREPGRVNINTIASERVWKGVINDVNASPRDDTTPWKEVADSRRGYATVAPSGEMIELNKLFPTRIANPFRSSAGLYLVPTDELKSHIIKTEINATNIRAKGLPETTTPANTAAPLFRLTRYGQHNDPFRNTYFRYQTLHRLDNMLTNCSNVYAVWVTIGYFEVEPTTWHEHPSTPPGQNERGLTQAQFLKIYPDGFRLGQELGANCGDVIRHRSFYITDRSIPVAFQRGQDINTNNAIILRRFIE